MAAPSIIPRRGTKVASLLLMVFMALAAVINVPWALTRMRSRLDARFVPTSMREGEIPIQWPSKTPHDKPWPAPTYWVDGHVFGCRTYDVRSFDPESDGSAKFHMDVQHLGWPLPVIELKQMWWDWDDPELDGVEPDPAPTLELRGLLLNPLIIGGGIWAILVLPWIIAVIAMRRSRRHRNRCMKCGYPIGESSVCTECGDAVR